MGLIFKDYVFKKLSYVANDAFSPQSEHLDLTPEIDVKIHMDNSSNEFIIVLSLIEQKESEETPFHLDVEMIGIFNYTDDFKDDINSIVENNAIAIMFPYLRSAITDLTQRTNEFPPFIIPIINISEMLKKQNKISYIDSEIKEE
ncbi:protein-export chaperone SecB [Mammaliicoccus sciuri]|uniref:protein-export chaperone SecB n=1 Tax=Mammaliicoccus sciuri TaxID=1296 RepID=UPI001FB2934E|nr:protein-export chaperone SecB [Mammaliicoccus sciuri]MCJ0909155.1 protein-export chaperone SecB [Mammaliicoccus sciuri]